MKPSMVNSKLFFFFTLLIFLFIMFALHKQRQLDQLKSRVSLLESSIENREHELRNKETFEKEIASLKDRVDSIQLQDKSDIGQCGTNDQLKEESIPNVKPLFDFLTARTLEAYHVFKKTLLSLLVKFLKSAIPYMQKLYLSAMPSFDQTVSVIKIFLAYSRKIITFLLNILKERLNDLLQENLEGAA
ncbi:hypothetical protein LR48_Vigan05g171500 [Vigna angularis]|uniref:Uncharacterized protein n=2 Tax=Phaseolus angularis TaxID=3914 RepID=A0A0L9UMI6_PHAAN|nr:uncharacterized protein LOC108333673 [Vigna angularis]KOM44110.1 hypothetical protein LR48_Vigan05g171500 [Vigna angularis]BAT92049.1 hypothetical protein VIGAN_07070700 [Vigna angularis var. angularis]